MLTDALHTMVDICAIAFCIFAINYSKRAPDAIHQYGYERMEVIAAFCVACFVLFWASFAFMEGIHHIISSEESEHSKNLFSLSGLGLLINFMGIMLFHAESSLGKLKLGEQF
jgi:cation diffusion facilitator family transporter